MKLGVIISVPGERAAGIEVRSHQFADEFGAEEAARIVNAANGRVAAAQSGGVVSFTVDPVTPFVFSHIEWL